MSDIASRVKAIIVDKLGVDENEVTPEASFTNDLALYAHCSRIIASSGASVKEGDVIAEVGETGVATGPHLHFELHEGSQYLNPIYYVSLA